MRYLYETVEKKHETARVAVSIPTTRPRILGQALAALANQTYSDYEVWIVYDGPMVVAEETAEIIRILSVSHRVWEIRGTGEGQVYAHNLVLWRTKSEYCLRLDDDVLMDKDALGRMAKHLDKNRDVAAVGGLWFPEGTRGRLMSKEEIDNDLRIENPNAAVQSNYHPKDDPVEAEHLYSVSLYRADAMRRAGGWPLCYTRKLHHREETDGTYRMKLLGGRLVILPSVTGIHLWAPGGIRDDPDVEKGYGRKREGDDQTFFVERFPRLPAIVRPKKVIVHSEHTSHAAGGERHFYATLAALSSADDLEVWGSDVGQGFFGAEDVERLFGLDTSRVRGFKRRWDWIRDDGIDLAVIVSHAMAPWFPAAAFMGLVLFPMEQKHLDSFSRLYGNSRYTSYHIKKLWGRDAGVIYPPPNTFEYDPSKKENRVLIVGWYGVQKGQWEAVQAFQLAQMGDWKLTMVGWPGTEGQNYYNAIKRAVAQDSSIELLTEVGWQELRDVVESSRIVLGMRGINTKDPRWQEHFGLSIPEAMSAGAVPLLFHSGGYLELYPRYTFSSVQDFGMMMRLMRDWGKERWDAEARMAMKRAADFGYNRYREEVLAAASEVLRGGAKNETPYVVGELGHVPDVVVVIPNYGHDARLWDSVGSALASTYRDFEIVVIDDGSPGTSESALMYNSDRVRLIRQPQSGPSIARNAGISASFAPMVFTLDADDYLFPDTLRRLRRENDGEVITYGDGIVLRDGEEPQQTNLAPYNFPALLEKDTIPQSALFPRWAWDKAGGFKPLRGYEDWEFWISLGEADCPGKKIDFTTYVYRESGTGGRHLEASELNQELVAEIRDIHRKVYGNPTLGCCAPRERPIVPEWLADVRDFGIAAEKVSSGPEEVDVIYDGPDKAPFNVRGNKSRIAYRVRSGQPLRIRAEDVEFIISIPGFRRV